MRLSRELLRSYPETYAGGEQSHTALAGQIGKTKKTNQRSLLMKVGPLTTAVGSAHITIEGCLLSYYDGAQV